MKNTIHSLQRQICTGIFFLAATMPVFSQSTVYKVAAIPGKVNTAQQEFGPSLSSDGNRLYFYSKRNGSSYTDLYISDLKDGKWSDPVPFSEMNSPYDDQSPYILKNGKGLLFSSNRDGAIEFKMGDGKIGISRDLYFAEFDGERWTKPKSMSLKINTPFIEENPYLTGNDLYFTRYPFGRPDEARVYKSVRKNNAWTTPVALPEPVNSDDSTIALVLTDDGKEIYFSSNRPGGYGGYDIYKSSIRDGKYSAPVNLGPEINTAGDEAYLIFRDSNKSFIFCRKNPGESYDIYESVEVNKDDFNSILKLRKKLTLNTIRFNINSSDLLPESLPELDKVVEFLRAEPEVRLKITGHTDLTGDVELNQPLSKERSQSVKKYFVTKGIAATRLETEGKGSTQPVVNALDENSNKLNRRTEFDVIK